MNYYFKTTVVITSNNSFSLSREDIVNITRLNEKRFILTGIYYITLSFKTSFRNKL